MDAVSDVLRVVRLGGAVYLNAEFTAPWCVSGQSESSLCSAYLPRSDRVISYHLIVEGSCWACVAGDPSTAVHVSAGELLVLPQGDANVLGSGIEPAPVPLGPLLVSQLESKPGETMTLSHGGGGAKTRLICGFLACDDTVSNPLLSSLPRIFAVAMRNDPRSAWLESSLQFAVAESAQSRPGSAAIIGKLSELMFVEAVRRHIDALPSDRKGWLAGVRDRFVGRALSLMHAQPAFAWTVEELARQVGQSRSGLAQRFGDLLGEPPMQYLTRWRLRIAAHEMLNDTKPLVDVAAGVGYDSEAAFSRAFKRAFGLPPTAWRKSRGKNGVAIEAATPERDGKGSAAA